MTEVLNDFKQSRDRFVQELLIAGVDYRAPDTNYYLPHTAVNLTSTLLERDINEVSEFYRFTLYHGVISYSCLNNPDVGRAYSRYFMDVRSAETFFILSYADEQIRKKNPDSLLFKVGYKVERLRSAISRAKELLGDDRLAELLLDPKPIREDAMAVHKAFCGNEDMDPGTGQPAGRSHPLAREALTAELTPPNFSLTYLIDLRKKLPGDFGVASGCKVIDPHLPVLLYEIILRAHGRNTLNAEREAELLTVSDFRMMLASIIGFIEKNKISDTDGLRKMLESRLRPTKLR